MATEIVREREAVRQLRTASGLRMFAVPRIPALTYPLLLLLLAGGLASLRLQGPIDLRYDAGVYYILGTSLTEGAGYRLLNEPGAPEAIQYPPGLPALAAAYQRLARTDDLVIVGQWLRVTYAVLFVACTIGAYLVGTLFLPPPFAFLAALATVLHVHTTWMAELFFAEIPFAVISLLVILLIRSGSPRVNTWAVWGLASIGFLLRTAGIALLAAWVGESLLRRRYRQFALRAALALVPVLAWQGYIAWVKAGPGYEAVYPYQRASYQFYNVSYLENLSLIDPFVPERGYATVAEWGQRLGRNLASMPASWGEAITADSRWTAPRLKHRVHRTLGVELPDPLIRLPFALVGLTAAVGFGLLLRRRELTVPLYVLGSTAIICLTPWPGQFQRYLTPLTPFLAIGFLVVAARLRDRIDPIGRARGIRAALVPATALALIAMQAWPLYRIYTRDRGSVTYHDSAGRAQEHRLFFYTDVWRAHDTMLDWLGSVARPGEVLVTSTPHWAYLRTGLPAVMPPFEADVTVAQAYVDAVPATYLLLDDLGFIDVSNRYAAPMVEAHPERWQLVRVIPDRGVRLYRRRD